MNPSQLTGARVGYAPGQPPPQRSGVGAEAGGGIELQRAGRRRWLIHRMLLIGDVLGLLLAFVCTQLLFALRSGSSVGLEGRHLLFFSLSLPLWIVLITLYSLYERDDPLAHASTVDDLPGTFHFLTIGSVIVFGAGHVSHVFSPDFRAVVEFWLLALIFIITARVVVRGICRRLTGLAQRTVILGTGEVGQLIARKLVRHPEYQLHLVGFVDGAPLPGALATNNATLLGTPQELPTILRRYRVERVIIAFSSHPDSEMIELIRRTQSDIQIDVVPRLYENLSRTLAVHALEGIPLLGLAPPRLSRSSNLIKRVTDLVLSGPLLFLLCPLLAVLAMLIKLTSPGPVFFRQVRVGAHGQPFRIYKFRTMSADADERKSEVAHLNKHAEPGGDPRMFKIPRRSASDARRQMPAPEIARRASSTVECPQGRHEPRRPASADRRRRPPRRLMGAQAALTQAGHHRLVAGARPERDPIRRDGSP